MRTARTVLPQSWLISAFTAMARADSLADGAQASSKSRNTRSAPEVGAFSHMRSLLAGVASSERRERSSRTAASRSRSDGAGRPQGGQPVGMDAEQLTEHRIVVGAEATPEVIDPPGRL